NYLVYVFSPNVICGKETLKSIKYPAFNNISKITYNSIHGMALSNYKKYILTNKSNTLKKLNTIARTLQFGITLFDKEILEFKTTNITTSQEIEELFKEMDIAHANSNLPEKPHAPEMLEDWLYDTRILELE
ncbi:MAG: hypothetical protein KAS07_06060, partial [Candidatus Pacebacteria bacterium]|nr:hypothetical protein [Candidatus Paceibacterota bacterium]